MTCNLSKVKRIVLLGPPGSKKVDLANSMKEDFGMNIVNTADILKEEISKQSEHSDAIKEAMGNGQLGK